MVAVAEFFDEEIWFAMTKPCVNTISISSPTILIDDVCIIF